MVGKMRNVSSIAAVDLGLSYFVLHGWLLDDCLYDANAMKATNNPLDTQPFLNCAPPVNPSKNPEPSSPRTRPLFAVPERMEGGGSVLEWCIIRRSKMQQNLQSAGFG